MRILRTLPTALICCSITSSVTAVQWLPFDVKPNGKAVSDESVQETTNEHFRRDETGITAVVLPDPPVLETPPLAGPHSICDRVPIEAYLMTNNVLYEGRAIESMWLCIQDAEFTPESSARLDSALTGSAVAPRIDQICIEYYAAQNRPWTDAHAAICRPVMLAAIRENTLYLLDERATAAPTTAAPSSTDKPTPIFPDPTPPPLDDSTSICDFVPVQARLSVDGVVIYEGIAIDGMCLCMQNGQFTSDSQVQLETALSGTYTTPRINQMCQDFYSALGRQYTDQDALDCPSAMSDILVANTLYILSQRSTACPYPANDFTPICGGDCAFICNPGFILCGDDAPRCVPLGTPCATGGLRKRHMLKTTCPQGYEACPISSNGALRRRGHLYECLITQTDIESCGGCVYPLPGARPGRDCTEILGAEVVQCLRGECLVETCRKGFSLIGNTCIEIPTSQESFWENVLQRGIEVVSR